jgi:glycosyltransferase involved in cell wall biosynthesis/2-polyprenyl-3-methyl-5-hydroxy-6-metoxy-1,4-benzoquinol methylase
MPDEVKKIHEDVEGLIEYSRNIVKHGHLAKPDYYKLLASCAYMLYPTDFPEISCINAIEAQYNGCLVITSDKYALSETVKSETKVKAEYGSAEYVTDFINLIDQYSGAAYDTAVADAKHKIEKFSWEQVAKNWNYEIDAMFKSRHEKYKDKIVDQLVYNSDLVAAWKLTGDAKYRQMLDKAETDNLTISKFSNHYSDEDNYLNGRSQQLIELVKEILEDDPDRQLDILDLGSNDGILSLPLMKRFGKNIKSMTLYDSSKEALDFVKTNFGAKYPQISYVVDNVSNVKQYNFSPDIVIVGELLEHIEDTKGFLQLIASLAKSNTLFYFTVPGGPWESIAKNNPDINHVHHFERRDIETIFKSVNPQIKRDFFGARGRRGEPVFNWLFWFNSSANNAIEFGEVDYTEKWLKTRPYKKISCCMIVKDEEDNLSRCLKSVTEFVDEIVIVDTGSTDNTKTIARRFTDKIYDLEWKEDDGLGNFSRARNYSVDQATGDYIFWIDADEQLENWRLLYKYLTSDYYDGVMLKQRQCMSKQSHDSGINVDVMHDRLFKKGQIRFTGVVHEYPSKDGEHFLSKMFWQDHAWILHYGLANMELLKKKSLSRNSDLIYKNVRTYPNRIFAKHYILVDYWSRFITDHPTPDLSWLERAMNMWHSELKTCGDDWTIRLSLGVIQHFYSYCAVNGIAYKGNLPQKVAFKNTEDEVVEFYVLDPVEETDFFLKYIATYRR